MDDDGGEDSAADEHGSRVCRLVETVPCTTRQRTPEPTNIYFEFVVLRRLIRALHERGLRSRRTFIMTLSCYEGYIVCIMKEDSGADEHL